MYTFKVSILIVLMAATNAYHHYGHDGPAHYRFEYGVHDPHTGDVKSQYEHRDGHHVRGAYQLKEADGTTRIVDYEAGPHSGFNAVVKRVGHAQHPSHYGHHDLAGYGHHGLSGYGSGQSYVAPAHFGYQHY